MSPRLSVASIFAIFKNGTRTVLRVGNSTFTTTKEALQHLPYFQETFSLELWEAKQDPDGEFFVDADRDMFSHSEPTSYSN